MGSICEMRLLVGLKGCGPSVDYEWSRKKDGVDLLNGIGGMKGVKKWNEWRWLNTGKAVLLTSIRMDPHSIYPLDPDPTL